MLFASNRNAFIELNIFVLNITSMSWSCNSIEASWRYSELSQTATEELLSAPFITMVSSAAKPYKAFYSSAKRLLCVDSLMSSENSSFSSPLKSTSRIAWPPGDFHIFRRYKNSKTYNLKFHFTATIYLKIVVIWNFKS